MVERTGGDVPHLLLHANQDELRDIRNSHLAIHVANLVVLDAVRRLPLQPTTSVYAGHDIGEYAALTAADALDRDTGVELVRCLGDLVHCASSRRPGRMAVIHGLDDDEVDVACRRATDTAWIAGFLAPGQVIVSGTPEGVDAACEHALSGGATKTELLSIDRACHSPLMSAVRRRLAQLLVHTTIRDSAVPVVTNIDGLAHDRGTDYRQLLAAQVSNPIRWKQTLQTFAALGVTTVIEINAGVSMMESTRRAAPGMRIFTIGSPDDLSGLDRFLSRATGVSLVNLGDRFVSPVRIVVSPAAGVFTPLPAATLGGCVRVGSVMGIVAGTVGATEVRSPFDGVLEGLIAVSGERVLPRQPIAWLRIT